MRTSWPCSLDRTRTRTKDASEQDAPSIRSKATLVYRTMTQKRIEAVNSKGRTGIGRQRRTHTLRLRQKDRVTSSMYFVTKVGSYVCYMYINTTQGGGLDSNAHARCTLTSYPCTRRLTWARRACSLSRSGAKVHHKARSLQAPSLMRICCRICPRVIGARCTKATAAVSGSGTGVSEIGVSETGGETGGERRRVLWSSECSFKGSFRSFTPRAFPASPPSTCEEAGGEAGE